MSLESENILKEGYLKMKFSLLWLKLYFVLTDDKLILYKDEEKTQKRKIVIEFSRVYGKQWAISRENNDTFCTFAIEHNYTLDEYSFKADDANIANEWIYILRRKFGFPKAKDMQIFNGLVATLKTINIHSDGNDTDKISNMLIYYMHGMSGEMSLKGVLMGLPYNKTLNRIKSNIAKHAIDCEYFSGKDKFTAYNILVIISSYENKDIKTRLEYGLKALECDPNSVCGLIHVAAMYYEINNFEKSVEYYAKANKYYYETHFSYVWELDGHLFNYIIGLCETNKYNIAKKYINKYYGQNNDPENNRLYCNAILCCYQINKSNNIVKCFEDMFRHYKANIINGNKYVRRFLICMECIIDKMIYDDNIKKGLRDTLNQLRNIKNTNNIKYSVFEQLMMKGFQYTKLYEMYPNIDPNIVKTIYEITNYNYDDCKEILFQWNASVDALSRTVKQINYKIKDQTHINSKLMISQKSLEK